MALSSKSPEDPPALKRVTTKRYRGSDRRPIKTWSPCCGDGVGAAAEAKVAVTDALAESVTAQEPVPAHAPLHPEKREPDPAAAVSVTLVPWANCALQVEPQLIPAGALETVPVPAPALATESVKFPGEGVGVGVDPEPSNWAVTVLAESIVSVHWPRT